ncbi:MAG: hypothetical protein ACP5KZ_09175 [bacterium]
MKGEKILFLALLIFRTVLKADEHIALKGPFADAFHGPFVVIYSSPPGKAEASVAREMAEKFSKLISPEASGLKAGVKKEELLTQSDISNHNICLFALFRDSSFLKRIKGSLPIIIEDDKLQVIKRIYKGDVGLILACPNPLNPSKYLAIFGATSAEALSHVLDFLEYYDDPIDYMIYVVESKLPTVVEAGIFDKKNEEKWKPYPCSVPLEEVRWDYNPSRNFKGLVTQVQLNVIWTFPQDALIIYGTQSTDEVENRQTYYQALKKYESLSTWHSTDPSDKRSYNRKIEMKSDKEVKEEELKEKNLILFGTPQSNAVLNKIKDKLPVKFKGKFLIARMPHTGEWVGIVMACPSPFNPKKFLLLYSGVTYKGIFWNAWASDLDDYVIYRNSPTGPHGSSSDIVLEKGTLDMLIHQ